MEDRAVRGIQTVIRYIRAAWAAGWNWRRWRRRSLLQIPPAPHVHRDGGNDAS